MLQVSVSDITRRKSMRTNKFNRANIVSGFPRLYTESGVFCHENTIQTIQKFETLSEDTNVAFDKALDAFCELCLNANESAITTQLSFLVENVDKVRDAGALMNSIKYKNSRLKTKISTKINNKISTVNGAITNSLGQLQNTLSKAGTSTSPGVAKTTKVSEAFIDECFNKLYNRAKEIKECDRILENYFKITKNFNIRSILECMNGTNDIYQAIIDITECVDQFNISFKAKFSAALETSIYALENTHIEYPKRNIVEAVTDYFIMKRGLSETEVADIQTLSTNSVLYDQEDFEDDAYLWQISVSNDNTSTEYIDPEYFGADALSMLTESLEKAINDKKNEIKHGFQKLKKDGRAFNKMVKTNAKKGNPEEAKDEEIKNMVDEFRKNCTKDPEKKNSVINLKAMVNKIFTRNPAQIIYELPSIFSIIRAFFIVATIPINPIIAIVAFITDQCIKLTLERKQMEKIISAYKNEIDSCNKRIEKIKNEEEKEKLTKYKDKLKEDLEKLREYDNSNYSEEENDERGAYNYDDDFDDSEFNFDMGDDDEWGDLDFKEASITAASIVIAEQLMESICESSYPESINELFGFGKKKTIKYNYKVIKELEPIITAACKKYSSKVLCAPSFEKDGTYEDIIRFDLTNNADQDEILDKYADTIEKITNYLNNSKLPDYVKSVDCGDGDEGSIYIHLNKGTRGYTKEALIDDNLDGVVCDNIFKLNDPDIDQATDFVMTIPVLHEKEKLCEAMINERNRLRSLDYTIESSMRIDTLNTNIEKLKQRNLGYYPESMKGTLSYLKSLNELTSIDGDEQFVHEMNFSNTLKLAMNNLKRDAVKLTDKEKRMSQELDASVAQVSKSLQTAVMNGNREAVIKGSIIPSASKCIKMAIAGGVLWMINPAIAVITAIGTFACMKKMQNKERQLVIDDIEIELKMCERYIQQAENKNDLKKVRELEKIQRNLQRQLQRIKYKMNIEYGMKTPDADATPRGLDR